MESTNHPTPVTLSDAALNEIEDFFGRHDDPARGYASSLCQTVRALRAEIAEWESHRDGIIEAVKTAEARVEELEEANTALREQLAEAHKNIESLTQTIFRSEQSTRMRERCVAHLRATADAHERGSKVEFDDCSMVAFHLRKAATDLESLDGEKEQ